MFPETIQFIDVIGLMIISLCVGIVIGILAQRRRCQWWRKQVKAIYDCLKWIDGKEDAKAICRKSLGLEDGKL